MRLFLGMAILAAALSGCARFPELDAAVSEAARAADYPSLVPAERILSRKRAGRLAENDGEILLARAANLRRRAAILRGIPVVDEDARLRFADRLRRLGG